MKFKVGNRVIINEPSGLDYGHYNSSGFITEILSDGEIVRVQVDKNSPYSFVTGVGDIIYTKYIKLDENYYFNKEFEELLTKEE